MSVYTYPVVDLRGPTGPIGPSGGNSIVNGTSSVIIASADGNVSVAVNGVNEVAVFSPYGITSSAINSPTSLNIHVGTEAVISGGPFRLPSFTTTARNALSATNGQIIYNTTLNKFQGYENGAWVNLI